MILGLFNFLGSVIILVSPIALVTAVVALLPGDQMVSERFLESINALPDGPALATGVCSKGVARRRTTSVLCCDGGAVFVLASTRAPLTWSSILCLIDNLHAFASSCDTIIGGRSMMSMPESPSVGWSGCRT